MFPMLFGKEFILRSNSPWGHRHIYTEPDVSVTRRARWAVPPHLTTQSLTPELVRTAGMHPNPVSWLIPPLLNLKCETVCTTALAEGDKLPCRCHTLALASTILQRV